METTTHPFEAAGLGKAPFTFTRSKTPADRYRNHGEGSTLISQMMMVTNTATTCDYCGIGIQNAVYIRSADGKTFKVGSECAKRAGEHRIAAVATRKVAATKRAAKSDTVKAELTALLADEWVRARLAEVPFRGRTLLDRAEWMLENAGAKGRAETLKAVKAAI